MSITDELREWFKDRLFMGNGYAELAAIADRIDAEHQKALDEWKAKHGQMWLKGYSECHAELLEGNETLASDLERCGWIRLPKDADGVPWHIGDRTESGQTIEAMGLNKYGWHFVGTVNEIDPAIHRHYHAPTVEDVLREFADEVYADADNEIRDRDFLCAKYAKRLTLAEGEDA